MMPALAVPARRAEAGEPLALALIGAALVLTVLAPLWLLLLTPLVLGAPHLVSDVRFLILRPPGAAHGLTRAVVLALALPLAALTGLRVWGLFGGANWPALEAALGGAALVGAVAAGGGTAARQLPALALALGVLALGWTHPWHVALGLAHLHNLVALGIWLAWSRGRMPLSTRLAVVLAVVAAGAAIGLGACDRLLAAAGGLAAPATGLDLDGFAATLAPGLPPTWALRLVLLYAFAQALHYVVWLVLIPRLTPTRSLRGDLGPVALGVALALVAVVPLAGCFAPVRVRAIYLSLVLFHGWLELAVMAHLWTRDRLRAAHA
jgi:hypothetical protein